MTETKTIQVNECKARVLVVENDPRTADLHHKNLLRWGYEPFVAEGFGEDLLEDAQKKARDHACHVALVDMRLMDDYDKNDKSGLDLVPKLKPTLSIIVSGSGNDRATTLEAINKEAIDFIGKEEVFDFIRKEAKLDKLRNAIQKAVYQMFAVETKPEIHIHVDFPQLIMNALAPGKPDQVHEIFCALFPDANQVYVRPIGGEALTPKITTRQRSFVFRVNADNLQPVIVKFASIERIKSESAKYAKHVKYRVRGSFYAQVQQSVLRWQIGAIVYDFIGANQDHFRLFQDYYDSATTAKLKKVIEHLFTATWGTIYRQTRESKTQSLLVAYTEVWGKEWIQRLERYADTIPQISLEIPDELKLLNPIHWLIRRSIRATNDESLLPYLYLAIGHGDMLGDNFFVDQHDQAWTIDYERTGLGPIVQDFVLLEIDILVRLVSTQSDNLLDFWRLSIQLFAKFIPKSRVPSWADNDLKKAYNVIRFLRQKADGLLDYEKERHYLWGLLFNAVFRLTILQEKLAELLKSVSPSHAPNHKDKIDQLRLEQQRALIISVLICYRLDHWNEAWPPKSWKRFMQYGPSSTMNGDSPELMEHIKILFLTANPSDTTRLRIDEEQRTIDQEIRKTELRDRFQLITHHAVRVKDVQELLQRHKPNIVHFSGYGTTDGKIIMNDETENGYAVPPNALSNLFKILKKNIRCVVLNACYSQNQATGIAEQIDAVIGMDSVFDDDSAIKFSASFYLALGYGENIQNAFELGKNAIDLSGSTQSEAFQLITSRSGPIFLHKPS